MQGSKAKQKWDYVIDYRKSGKVVSRTFTSELEARRFYAEQAKERGVTELSLTRFRRELRRSI